LIIRRLEQGFAFGEMGFGDHCKAAKFASLFDEAGGGDVVS
jgi:hypothetical protein